METNVISNVSEAPIDNGNSKMWKYIIILLILALLGFNIFTYIGKFSNVLGSISYFLGELTNRILSLFKPILAYFGYGISETAKKTIDFTATGTKKVIDITAGTATGGINILQKGLKTSAQEKKNEAMPVPLPDDASSMMQASKASRKSGFCYIGEDRGFRSCISVGEGDECMSGDIFPTREVCINPNLR